MHREGWKRGEEGGEVEAKGERKGRGRRGEGKERRKDRGERRWHGRRGLVGKGGGGEGSNGDMHISD